MDLTVKDGWIYLGNDKERYVLGQPGVENMLVFGVNPSTAVPGKDDHRRMRKRRLGTSDAGRFRETQGTLRIQGHRCPHRILGIRRRPRLAVVAERIPVLPQLGMLTWRRKPSGFF